MEKLRYDELLDYYGILIDLVTALKAEKEAYNEASRDAYEHPSEVPKNFDSTSFTSQDSNSRLEKAQKLLDIQHYIDQIVELVDINIEEMVVVKRQLDFLLKNQVNGEDFADSWMNWALDQCTDDEAGRVRCGWTGALWLDGCVRARPRSV